MNRYDVAIIGGGPGGLSCARMLAQKGAKVILLERKKNIGRKVCAGGITWHGLIRQVPKHLIQRIFPDQHIYSNWQRICFSRQDPVIATVNREELGRWMMEKAVETGATIRTSCQVKHVSNKYLKAADENGNPLNIQFDHLVGADGSTSLVRRHLGISAVNLGVGINYQLKGTFKHMEWHLNTALFGSGYGWVFPHRDSISIGAYTNRCIIKPGQLKRNLIRWARERGFDLSDSPVMAEFINYDYRGHQFGNTWLVGDAAGLASGLTGEGINPAIVSGEEVAKKIIDPCHQAGSIERMIKKQQRHAHVVQLASRSKLLCTIFMESLVMMLRLRILDFQKELSM